MMSMGISDFAAKKRKKEHRKLILRHSFDHDGYFFFLVPVGLGLAFAQPFLEGAVVFLFPAPPLS